MFDNQNKNFNSIKTQTDSVDVSNLPLRTMEKDLKNINNPAFNASDFMPEGDSPVKKEAIESNLSEKQKTSPFLAPPTVNPAPKIQSNPPKTPAPIEKNIEAPVAKDQGKKFDLKKVGLFAGGIFVVLFGIISGYYLITSRSSKTQPVATQPAVPSSPVSPIITTQPAANNTPAENNSTAVNNPDANNPEQNPATEQVKINSDKPNFLVIGPEAKEKIAIQNIIKKKIEEVKTTKIYTPIEFVLTDASFAPLTFQNFFQKIGLTLPSSITDSLKPTFSLFIYNTDKNQASLGLLIDAKDGQAATLKPLLSKEEPQLLKELDSLFLGTSYQANGVSFSTNNYKNTDVRFHNIQLDASMAIDYTILNNKFMLATSKSAALSLVDKLLAK